jgi:hypothetical protein
MSDGRATTYVAWATDGRRVEVERVAGDQFRIKIGRHAALLSLNEYARLVAGAVDLREQAVRGDWQG